MTEKTTTQADAWTRFAIERESTGGELGVFRSVLATSGEASDGHVLSIEGMRVPDSMPLLFRHQSTVEIPTLGRVEHPTKSQEAGREVLRVSGRIDTEGEAGDPLLAIRRGFASLVQSGSLDAMSVRWDPVFGKFVPRSTLPEDHHAYASRNTEGPAAFGMYFEESEAREGSIVAIGADPAALVGRANEAASMFEEAFWLTVAGRVSRGDAAPEIPAEQRAIFETLTKIAVDTIQRETREIFSLLTREQEEELGESLAPVEVEAPTEETVREAPVEDETKPAEPEAIGRDKLRGLILETAKESADRKLAFALGRVAQ